MFGPRRGHLAGEGKTIERLLEVDPGSFFGIWMKVAKQSKHGNGQTPR